MRRGEAVDIGEAGLGLVQQRLGRGVVRGHHLAGQRAAELVGRAGDAEVGQRRAEPRAQDVRRLHVAVHDAGLVRGVQRLADLDADLEHVVDRQRALLAQDLRVGTALAVLHHDVGPVVVGDAGVDDRHDVRLARQRDGGGQLACALTGTEPVSTVITLIATGRLRLVWMARNTSAVVPCAISCGLSYPGSAGSSGAFMTPVPPSGLFPGTA